MTPFDCYIFIPLHIVYSIMGLLCAFFIGFPCCAIYFSYKETKQIERKKHRKEMEKLYYNCLERIENMKGEK